MMTVLEEILSVLAQMVQEGVTGLQLDEMAKGFLTLHHCESAFYRYQFNPNQVPFPSSLCVSINNEVIHGIPTSLPFRAGDVVKLDIGLKDAEGQYDDGASTVIVGKGSAIARRLVVATKEALHEGIHAARSGNTTQDITRAIEAVAKREGFIVVKGYGGHGIGSSLHMEPFIPNEVEPNSKVVALTKGMRLAIEPMFCTRDGRTFIDSNGWTVKTTAGISAHFEKTVIV